MCAKKAERQVAYRQLPERLRHAVLLVLGADVLLCAPRHKPTGLERERRIHIYGTRRIQGRRKGKTDSNPAGDKSLQTFPTGHGRSQSEVRILQGGLRRYPRILRDRKWRSDRKDDTQHQGRSEMVYV